MILRALETEAGKVGLRLNEAKCVELAINSDQPVMLLSGGRDPRASSVKYLGVFLSDRGSVDRDVAYRCAQAEQAFSRLKPMWKAAR
eukprot:4184965-Alexandrium_andersonii.AAC.1